MGRKLYVGNLPYSASEQDLQDLFSQAGPVDSVNVMRDMATGRARGFAFVEMGSDADAQKAIDQFNNTDLGGRNLTVNEARPKTPGGGGGYGGGGGGGSRRREPRWDAGKNQAQWAALNHRAARFAYAVNADPAPDPGLRTADSESEADALNRPVPSAV